MYFGSTTRRSNTFIIKPRGYEFSRFEKYWSSFLHSCAVCTIIYNKSWVLPCSASVDTSLTFKYNSVDWCVVYTSQMWDLMCTRGLCISVTTSDVLTDISDVWCFWQQIWCWLSCWFSSPILYPFRMKIVRFIIFKFLSSISHSRVCLVIVPNWSSLPSIGNNITLYAYNRFFHLNDDTSLGFAFNVGFRTWRGIGAEPSPESLQQGALRLCKGAWHSKIWQNSTDLKCFIFQFGGAWSFVWRAKPTKDPHGDGTVLVMGSCSLY